MFPWSDQLRGDEEEGLGLLHHDGGDPSEEPRALLQLLRLEPARAHQVRHEDGGEGGRAHAVTVLPRLGRGGLGCSNNKKI